MRIFGLNEWKDFFQRLYTKADATDIFNRAAQVAFYFSFAFFPLLLFLVTLAGLVLGTTEGLKNDLYSYLFRIMPASAYELVHKTLDEIIDSSSGGKLTIGIFVTLWSASAGVDTLRSSLNAVYELRETRSWWNTKLQSLLLTLLFIALLALALILVSSGLNSIEYLLGSIGFDAASSPSSSVIHWAALLVVLLFATEVIYSWLPCHKKFHWFWLTPGSLVAMFLWILFSGGFRIYLQYFNTYNRAYGSLGAVIILMLWMFLTGLSILLGGAINSVLKEMANEAGRESASPAEEDVHVEC
ncbi:MAG: YihY/virulence factor BrkB family protein [Chloracidobacterium sp.]|nr:YihY/virulence factor BrkB family protein [Chloracidobacterium sp.]